MGALDDLQLHKAPDDPYKRMIARLAFLAPDIQAAILDGDQPRGLTLNALSRGDIPVCWEDQRRVFGFKR